MQLSGDLKVLLVDDNVDLLDSMKDLFTLFGFSVVTATDGENAWQILQDQEFNIVLTDVRMAPMDGFELLKKIKDRNLHHPKVVISTAYSDYSIADFFSEGADAFFIKPFDASTVRDCLWQSVMGLNERWQVPPKAQPNASLDEKFDSMQVAQQEGQFSLGRLGFFLAQEPEKCALFTNEQWINFDIGFAQDDSLSQIQGTGRVKWIREEPTSSAQPGIGVEIKYLEPDCIKNTITFINGTDVKASIPLK